MNCFTTGLISGTTDIAQLIPEVRLIREAIDSDRLLIVVGAGVSISATKNNEACASWNGLLKLGLNTIQDKTQRLVFESLLQQGDSKSAIRIAEGIEDAFGGRSDVTFHYWLKETVGRLRPAYREVLEAIRELRVPIATTNYDRLLEEVTGRAPITLDDIEESLGFVRNENTDSTILHIHGYYEKPQSVIFGTRSYYDLLNKGYAEAVLRALAIRYTWLFIGCGQGLQDPHFDDLITWMDTVLGRNIPWHYYLVSKEDKTQIKGRIKPICYGEDHTKLEAFLRALAPTLGAVDAKGSMTLCTTRDDQLRAFRKALLQNYPKPIAILGGLGLGKTTFCMDGVYAPDVVARYSQAGADIAETGLTMYDWIRPLPLKICSKQLLFRWTCSAQPSPIRQNARKKLLP